VSAHARHQWRRNQRRPLPHWKAELRRLERRELLTEWAQAATLVALYAALTATLAVTLATLAIKGV